MAKGWIKLHRKLIESPAFDNPKLLKIWVWCLCKASHTECEKLVGRQIVKLEPGQFVFGRLKAAESLNMNDRTVYDYIKTLEKLGMIYINSNNKFSVITVVNWELYQGNEIENQQQSTIKSTIESTIKSTIKSTIENNTNKNVKNDKECTKKERKNIYGTFKHVKLTDEEKDRLIADYGESFFKACISELDEYKERTGKTYKNDNLTIRKWVVDAVKRKGGVLNNDQRAEQRADYEQVCL